MHQECIGSIAAEPRPFFQFSVVARPLLTGREQILGFKQDHKGCKGSAELFRPIPRGCRHSRRRRALAAARRACAADGRRDCKRSEMARGARTVDGVYAARLCSCLRAEQSENGRSETTCRAKSQTHSFKTLAAPNASHLYRPSARISCEQREPEHIYQHYRACRI
jgi:hypothetical protein